MLHFNGTALQTLLIIGLNLRATVRLQVIIPYLRLPISRPGAHSSLPKAPIIGASRDIRLMIPRAHQPTRSPISLHLR